MTKTRIILIGLTASALGACSSGSSDVEEATGEGSISGLHAISDLGPVNFMIEETTIANIDYKEFSGIVEYDDLTYNFNFDILLPDETEFTRMATAELSVVADTAYTFVLTGSLADPQITLWQQINRDWQPLIDEAEANETEVTILDASFGHVAHDVGTLDIYLAEPGTVPALGNEVATISFGTLWESTEMDAGEYQLIATDPGDPANYRFASDPFTLGSAVSVNFVIMDADDSVSSEFVVRLIGSGTGTQLVEINATSSMRVVHAADNTGALDVIIGDGFTDPFVSSLAFGERSGEKEVQPGVLNLNVTPEGNPGSFLAEETISVLKGGKYSFYLSGLPGQLNGFLLPDSTRRLVTHSLLRVYQGSARVSIVDFYVAPRDSDISLLSPTMVSLPYTSAAGYQQWIPGSYDLVFTLPGTKTIVGGPMQVELDALGIYDVVATDTSQTDRVDVLFFSDE